jgi:hypothetical protein
LHESHGNLPFVFLTHPGSHVKGKLKINGKSESSARSNKPLLPILRQRTFGYVGAIPRMGLIRRRLQCLAGSAIVIAFPPPSTPPYTLGVVTMMIDG